MESKTYLTNIKVSPKKMRFYTRDMKKKSPDEVLSMLDYTPGKAAKIWRKSIKTALNNAQQSLKVNSDRLTFKALSVDGGFKLKRYRPGGRGASRPFAHRLSHIRIVLEAVKKPTVQPAPVKDAKSKSSRSGKTKK